MLRGIVICFIYIHAMVFVQFSTITTGCDEIEVSNSRYQKAMHGIYHKLSRSCTSRPMYKHARSEKYVFYLRNRFSNGYWMIGPSPCDKTYGKIKARSSSMTPDQVLTGWQENNGKKWGRWVYSDTLQVRCYHHSDMTRYVTRTSTSGVAVTGKSSSDLTHTNLWIIPVCIVVVIIPIVVGIILFCRRPPTQVVQTPTSSGKAVKDATVSHQVDQLQLCEKHDYPPRCPDTPPPPYHSVHQ